MKHKKQEHHVELRIEKVPVDGLRGADKNSRRHSAAQIRAIAASLLRFGQRKNVVLDSGGRIVAGHGTVEAARMLGWETVACDRSSLDGSEAVAYGLADNQLGLLSEWHDDIRAEQLRSLQGMGELGFAAEEQGMRDAASPGLPEIDMTSGTGRSDRKQRGSMIVMFPLAAEAEVRAGLDSLAARVPSLSYVLRAKVTK